MIDLWGGYSRASKRRRETLQRFATEGLVEVAIDCRASVDGRAHLVCWGTYPGGSAAPSPKKKSSMCLATRSCASFCHGISRYSLRIIFIRSSQSFHASFETFSKMRCPSSPGQGGESSPGSSFWNFAHITFRPLLLVAGAGAGECPQESAMPPIVVDLRRLEYGEFGIDGKPDAGVRHAQRALDLVSTAGACKDEPEIARALRQRHQHLIRFRRNADFVDVGHRAREVDPFDTAIDSAPWNRDHHHPGCGALAMPRPGFITERVTQQQFLQRDLGFGIWDSNPEPRVPNSGAREAKTAGAEAANWTRGDFEDEDTIRVDAALAVDGAVIQADRLCRLRDGVPDGALVGVGGGTRRHVDCFLEERTVERVGFVEDRQHMKGAVVHQAFERVLAARDERFDERELVGLVSLGPQVRRPHQRAQPFERRGERRRIVRAQHAPASRERHGFDDARVG